ncbi:Wound-induced protein WIN2 [Linum perenne]
MVLNAQLATANRTRHERRDHRCGPSFNCTPCGNGRCCSIFSYCGGGYEYCGVYECAYQCPFDSPPCELGVNVSATGVEKISGYNGSTAYLTKVGCGTNRANVSMSWVREHGRRVFCNLTDTACGECLKVTDARSGTHTMIKLTNLDCNEEDLNNIGHHIFKELDVVHGDDHQENSKQNLTVDYQIVQCY